MTEPRQPTDNDWIQLSMLPIGLVEVTLRVGYVVETNHLQAQVEVRDPSQRRLMGMRSWPSIPSRHQRAQLEEALDTTRQAVLGVIYPF